MFGYFSDSNNLIMTKCRGDLIIIIDNDIIGKTNLISTISRSLESPYPNDNWDGLHDALLDLSWVQKKNVKIIHRDLPSLNHSETLVYLSILKSIDTHWTSLEMGDIQSSIINGCGRFRVFFPLRSKDLVDYYLQFV